MEKIAAALLDERGCLSRDPVHEKKKFQRLIVAEEAISDALYRWTGQRPDEKGRIPIVRDGRYLGHYKSDNALAIDGTSSFAQSILEWSTQELKSQLKALKKMHAALTEFRGAVRQMGPDTVLALQVSEEVFRDADGDLEEKVLSAVGWLNACFVSGIRLLPVLEAYMALTENRLENRRHGKGRHREEAVYSFAYALARLYAKSTGKMPTFSKDADGYYGDFTPVLRDSFDHVGWKKRTLDGPAQAAIGKLTQADLDLPHSIHANQEKEHLGRILGLGEV